MPFLGVQAPPFTNPGSSKQEDIFDIEDVGDMV